MSAKTIELGTLEYPYKSFSSINFEILNFFSHSNADIIIYTKNAYIEDDMSKYFNFSSVTITSHPEVKENSKISTIVPTAIRQNVIFEKTLYIIFSIQNDTSFFENYKFGKI